MTAASSLVAAMRAIVGDADAVDDPEVTAGYAVDWTGRWRGSTPAGRPARATSSRSPRSCRGARPRASPIVPQGGNTGLVGGGVPLAGEVVLSLRGARRRHRRRPRRRAADRRRRHDHRRRPGRRRRAPGGPTASTWPPATRATVGGTVATNAGGLRVLRYGDTRAQLLGRRGGARRRVGDRAPRRARQGQHRLPPAVAALRQRGHARHRHRGAAAAGAALRAAGGRPRRAAVDGRRPSSLGGHAPPDGRRRRRHRVPHRRLPAARRACRRRSATSTRCTSSSSAPATTTRPRRWPPPSATSPAAVAGPGEPGRRAELWRYRESITEAINAGSARRSSSTSRCRRPALAAFVDDVPAVAARRRRRVAVRARRRRQRPRERHRRRPRRRVRRRRRAAPGGRAGRLDQRRARHRPGQAAVAPPRARRRPSWPPCGPIKAALDPPGS